MCKCSGYYCVPWEYVCDGKQDCPVGADEAQICTDRNRCANMLKSKISLMCIHIASVCNGVSSCLLDDDELICELKNQKCIFGCRCLTFAVLCVNVDVYHFTTEVMYASASFFAVFGFKTTMFEHFANVALLQLIDVNLLQICPSQISASILSLVLSKNKISRLTSYCFSNQKQVRIVVLDFNKISVVQTQSFSNLVHLVSVNLSHNHLDTFPKKYFPIQFL